MDISDREITDLFVSGSQSKLESATMRINPYLDSSVGLLDKKTNCILAKTNIKSNILIRSSLDLSNYIFESLTAHNYILEPSTEFSSLKRYFKVELEQHIVTTTSLNSLWKLCRKEPKTRFLYLNNNWYGINEIIIDRKKYTVTFLDSKKPPWTRLDCLVSWAIRDLSLPEETENNSLLWGNTKIRSKSTKARAVNTKISDPKQLNTTPKPKSDSVEDSKLWARFQDLIAIINEEKKKNDAFISKLEIELKQIHDFQAMIARKLNLTDKELYDFVNYEDKTISESDN